jgi:hypothetical protein
MRNCVLGMDLGKFLFFFPSLCYIHPLHLRHTHV